MKKTILISIAIFMMSGAKAQVAMSPRVGFETQCLGVEEDGTQTLRVWGFGSKKKDAVEQAMKTAVRDILFKGIHAGMEGCNTRPMLTEVNARERHEAYFNKFFADGNRFKKYVSFKDEKKKKKSREHTESTLGTRWSIVVTVKCPQLRQRLIKDKIIQKDYK